MSAGGLFGAHAEYSFPFALRYRRVSGPERSALNLPELKLS
jgi:hypothetical protein